MTGGNPSARFGEGPITPAEARMFGRLNALSYLVENMYALGFMQADDPVAAARALGAEAARRMSSITGGSDPVLSDAVAAESQEAVERMFGEIVARLEEQLKARPRPAG